MFDFYSKEDEIFTRRRERSASKKLALHFFLLQTPLKSEYEWTIKNLVENIIEEGSQSN